MKKIMTLIVVGVLLFCGSAFAQNVIDFESSPVDVLADDVYQATNPLSPGVVIDTVDNATGDTHTGWPVVVRAYEGSTYCGLDVLGLTNPGTVGAFDSRLCGSGNTTRNYPVPSGWNSLSDTSEGLPPIAQSPRLQDGYRVHFAGPVSDVSVKFADWGDYFPNSSETYPSYIEVIALDKDGSQVCSAQGPQLNSAPITRDAARADGLIQVGCLGSGIRTFKIMFKGKIDPGVAIDDITFSTHMDIDIKPGSYPNCFNSDSKGVIPVAILGSDDFDVTIIDPFSVALDGQLVRVKGKSGNAGSYEDVNGDGFIDLVVQIQDDGIYAQGTSVGIITAMSYDGLVYSGQDSLCITQ